ncbi:MAG TPA: phosphotransferase, partial [Solirubrobacterales bacterium]|nr:phosphotransferase [Solirubrobacterales bacterium]
IASLFQSDSAGSEAAPFAVDGVKLEPLAGGRSRAAVLLARLSAGESAGRVACVVKVAPLLESLEESQRYERLVRFRVAPDRRAELLNSVCGDTVGGVVYAFAGESPERVRDLDSYLAEESDSASAILHDFLGAKGDDLWREVEPGPDSQRTTDLGKYFFDTYRLRAEDVGVQIKQYFLKRAKQLGFEKDGETLVAGETRLSLPDEGFYGGAKIRRHYTEAFIHGDLNARNVLISDDGRVRLIDFRYAGFGPVATDFAAIEASIRMRDEEGAASADALSERVRDERRLLSAAWNPERKRPESVKLPYWARTSEELVWLAQEVSPSLRREEYLATCLLYALRVTRVRKLEEAQKIRLIAWVTVLCSALER